MKKLLLFLVSFLLVVGPFLLYADEEEKVEETPPWGFIFNTDNLFMDIESYQAGVGIKLLKEDNKALRLLADLFYSNSANTLSMTLGVTMENHFHPGRVSPYWGWFVQAGFLSQKSEVDTDNWTRNSSFPVSAGGVLGVEFFILEFLSVFAEYSAVFSGTLTTSSTSTAGVVSKADPEFSFSLDTGIGNESKLGITIYMENIVKIEKKD